jgi:TPR repeat protein
VRGTTAAPWIACSAVLVALWGGSDLAGPLEDGRAAYDAQDFAKALALWRPLAEKGDPDAQFDLAVLYDRGEGVARNTAQALGWYRRAANGGNAKAQYNLGLIYDFGGPAAPDPRLAVYWYRKAADQGDAASQYNLAFLIDNGLGVRADPADAARWLLRSANQGDVDAQNDLGGAYWRGRGVPLDLVEAYKWASLAAAGAPPGPVRDKAAHNRDLIGQSLTADQLATATSRANAWAPRPERPSKP